MWLTFLRLFSTKVAILFRKHYRIWYKYFFKIMLFIILITYLLNDTKSNRVNNCEKETYGTSTAIWNCGRPFISHERPL